MRLHLLILILTVGAITCQDEHTLISSSEIEKSPRLQYLANYGAQSVVKRGYDLGYFPNTLYSLSRIYRCEFIVFEELGFYHFDVELTNNKSQTIRAQYSVTGDTNSYPNVFYASYNKPSGQSLNNIIFQDPEILFHNTLDYFTTEELLGEDVIISNESPELELEWLGEAWIVGEDDLQNEEDFDSRYSPIDVAEFNDHQEAQNLLYFGIRHILSLILNSGTEANLFPFEATRIYSIAELPGERKSYQYDVELEDNNKTVIRSVFVVFSGTHTEEPKVGYYAYDISTNDNGEFYGAGSNSNKNLPAFHVDEVNGHANIQDTKDPIIQAALNEGLHYVVQHLIGVGRLPDGEYTYKLQYAGKYEGHQTHFEFDVKISANGVPDAQVEYFVVYDPETKRNVVLSYVNYLTTDTV